jgi:hypothetical protein
LNAGLGLAIVRKAIAMNKLDPPNPADYLAQAGLLLQSMFRTNPICMDGACTFAAGIL